MAKTRVVAKTGGSTLFKVCNSDYLDSKKCIAGLKTVARMHASSLIFEQARSTKESSYRLNEHFSDELNETTFSFKEGHVRNMWCKTATKCLQDLSKFFTDDPGLRTKIKQYIFSDDGLKKYLKPSKKYRNTVCHDDLWLNNLMFNEKNDCMLLDFQLSRYTPPVFDVLLFLYLGTERSFLNENMSKLLDLYYGFLSDELSRHNLNIEKIISKGDFMASIDEYTLPALIEAGMYGTNVYLPEELSAEVISSPETFLEFTMKDRSSFVVKEFEHNKTFRERYSTVLQPLFQAIEKL